MGLLSTLLLVGALNGVLLAILVMSPRPNRMASQFLAALIAIVSMRLIIYVLGFAGTYDAHRELTFLPLDLSLGFGPLIWLYVATLVAGERPAAWWRHLAPAALQLGYYLACFALPLSQKWAWFTDYHLIWVAPLGLAAVLASSAIYLVLSWRAYTDYQRGLDERFSNGEPWRLNWLRLILLAFGALVALTTAFALWNLSVAPLDYFDRTPVMFASCALIYLLGLMGWRHGAVAYPRMTPANTERPTAARKDYAALAADWRRRAETAGWWREESLTLGDLADRLGVSERSLSRALNTGAGQNFNGFVNGLRVDAVMRALDDPRESRDLLALALASGFNSKASFNRAFKQATGWTPSAFRAARTARREIRQSSRQADSEATAAPR